MANLTLLGLNSGSTTLAPTDGANATLTLPTGTGTVITTANPQSGGVIQVVNATYSTSVSTGGNTFIDTGLTATITPKFSTSKILVIFGGNTFASASTANAKLAIYRGGSQLTQTVAVYNGGSNIGASTSMVYLDSPATTSSTTYTIYASTNTGTIYLSQDNASLYGITLLEIAA